MKNIYRRYFEIKDTATLARIAELSAARSSYHRAVLDFVESIGAKEAFTRNEIVSGFSFTGDPDLGTWREGRDGWVPRKNTKAGKEMQARIDSLNSKGDVAPLDHALTICGLSPGFPVILDVARGVGCRVGLCGYGGEAPRWFASVPWFDEDPAKLAEYKAQRESGEKRTHWSCELDHLCWEPPAEWVELKQWEVEKALSDFKEKQS